MLFTNYDLPRVEEQERDLRILVATALELSCDYAVWPAPYLGPGGLVLHVYIERDGHVVDSHDPLRDRMETIRYLLPDEIEARARAMPDPRP